MATIYLDEGINKRLDAISHNLFFAFKPKSKVYLGVVLGLSRVNQ